MAQVNNMQSNLLPVVTLYNCTNNTELEIKGPSSGYFLTHLEHYQLIFIILSFVFTAISMAIAVVECFYVFRNISIEKRRNKLYFLITLFPITMTFTLVGMLVPRAAAIAMSGGMLYFLLCLFVLISLVRHLTNGRHQLSRELLMNGHQINFQSPPICCIMSCLPEARPTIRNLKLLEMLVLQAPIVRAVILFMEATIAVEMQRDSDYEMQLCEIATLMSIMTAVFGVHTMARLVSERLSKYGFMWMFRIVDISLMFFSAQHPIIFQNILVRFHLIPCGPILTPPQNARFLCNFLVICELFFLSLLSIFTVSPTRNLLFDLYGKPSQENEVEYFSDEPITADEVSISSESPPQVIALPAT